MSDVSTVERLQAELDTAEAHLEHMCCAHDVASRANGMLHVPSICNGYLRVRQLKADLAKTKAAADNAKAESKAPANAPPAPASPVTK